MKRFKKIAVVLIILVILFFIVPEVKYLITKSRMKKNDEPVAHVYTIEDVKAAHEGEMSDIEGWSVNDKIDAGLAWQDGSDSDGDGLTDKEEIETYHSDPKKNSTSGDLYSDGYKVANNMDLNTSYEYKNDLTYKMNSCDDVALTAASSHDFNAVVSRISNANIEGYTVYKTYDLYYFGGDLEISIADIGNVNANKLIVLVGPWHDGDMEKAKVKIDGDKLIVKYDFDSSYRYAVAVCSDDNLLDFKKPYHKLTYDASEDSKIGKYMYVHFFRFLSVFSGTKPMLFMVKSGNAENDAITAAFLVDLANTFGEGYSVVTANDIKYLSDREMGVLNRFMNLFGPFEVYCYDTPPKLFMAWCNAFQLSNSDRKKIEDAFLAILTGKTNEKPLRSNTGFDVSIDALPFQNFRSEYNQDGNCAGIAYYTAAMYKNGTMPTDGGYDAYYDNGSGYLSWDVKGDPENNTLADKILHDYKDSDFTNYHQKDTLWVTGLTSGEEEFVKMISTYFRQANDTLDASNHVYNIVDDRGDYSWQQIETIMDRLDNGEILILGMMREDGAGHAVNIVDYEISEDKNVVTFTLYDNNYADNSYSGTAINNKLIVTKKHCTAGYPESFTYYYRPYRDAYAYDSEHQKYNCRNFEVMDSDFNVLVW